MLILLRTRLSKSLSHLSRLSSTIWRAYLISTNIVSAKLASLGTPVGSTSYTSRSLSSPLRFSRILVSTNIWPSLETSGRSTSCTSRFTFLETRPNPRQYVHLGLLGDPRKVDQHHVQVHILERFDYALDLRCRRSYFREKIFGYNWASED